MNTNYYIVKKPSLASSGAARFFGAVMALWLFLTSPAICQAVPSFARQTNLQCTACHTEFPTLTAFGHLFKLNGYTLSTGQTQLPPLAVMLQPSFTHTSRGQPGGAAPQFGDNNNAAFSQVSIFYAGRLFGPYASDILPTNAAAIANKLGVFFQTTYDGAAKTWAWDNAELRYADTGNIAGHNTSYGFFLNNNPTMEDIWNSTPAWGFPFSGSHLAPGSAAATLIDGGVSQQVVGAGIYIMLSNSLYLDVAGYRTLGARFQKSMGIDPTEETQISGVAPYWRIAWERALGGNARWEIGTFGLAASTFPNRDSSAGNDRIVDIGLDSEYQNSLGRHDITATVSWIHEHQQWDASEALGTTSNPSDTLRNLKVTVDYLFDKTYGTAVQYFTINGDTDSLLYAGSATGSPRSDGFIFQLNYMPLNKYGGPSFWPRSNVKFSLQYTLYAHFDGSRTNYNGSNRNAKDNNTTYIEAWIVF